MSIDLFLCGGTIDKQYFPDREVFDFHETHIHHMIEQARVPDITLNVQSLFLKDSLDMDQNDREQIVWACKESLAKHILIVHGTSTMTESAEYLYENISKDKTVVFFGAMLPYELAKSDALFNFGVALSAVQLLESGVYIAMNGKFWKAGTVTKNVTKAVFMDTISV